MNPSMMLSAGAGIPMGSGTLAPGKAVGLENYLHVIRIAMIQDL